LIITTENRRLLLDSQRSIFVTASLGIRFRCNFIVNNKITEKVKTVENIKIISVFGGDAATTDDHSTVDIHSPTRPQVTTQYPTTNPGHPTNRLRRNTMSQLHNVGCGQLFSKPKAVAIEVCARASPGPSITRSLSLTASHVHTRTYQCTTRHSNRTDRVRVSARMRALAREAQTAQRE